MTRISGYDFMNLISAFDRSLEILINLHDEGKHDLVRIRAVKMRDVISKLKHHSDAKECYGPER
jgi:hypothetical protein